MAPPGKEKLAEGVAHDGEKKTGELQQVGRPAERQLEAIPIFKDEAESSIVHADLALSRVRELVSSLGGKVVSVEYEAETDRPQSIRVEIPGKYYQSFIEDLKEIASFQTPPPTLYEEDQESVLITIRFVPPT
jgi:hypothetical protein